MKTKKLKNKSNDWLNKENMTANENNSNTEHETWTIKR